MARQIFEKNYKNNPYIYQVTNALSSFCRDYDEACKTLDKRPNDMRSMMVRAYCMDFASWLSESTGRNFGDIGSMIIKMMELENKE